MPFDPSTMKAMAGVNGNWWLGLAIFTTVFMREHNAICERLARAHPDWDDDALFEHARLVNAALIAKIHTVEWTTALLGDSTMQTGMRANWWGFMGERFSRHFGRISKSEEVSGIPGSQTWLHGAPYAMTEEFVAVYRMHPLIPDDYSIRSASDDHAIASYTFPEISGTHTHEVLDTVAMNDLIYSFATSNPGAIVLQQLPEGPAALRQAGRHHPRPGRHRPPAQPRTGRAAVQRVSPQVPPDSRRAVRGLQRRPGRGRRSCGASTTTPRTST